jgi:quinol-cytochrome oxidoreductase complex cytochrome b subunit
MIEYFPLVGHSLQVSLRGGEEVNGATFLNFYSLHTGILPLLLMIIMVYHFWKVRKAKGVAVPEKGNKTIRVPSDPDLILRELTVGLVLIALILTLSIFFSAPLLDRANPAFSPNPAKAPWYFMGIQELLMHMHPFFAVVIIPVFYFGMLFYLPYLKWTNYRSGFWFHSSLGKKLAIEAVIFSTVLTPLAVLADDFLFRFRDWSAGWPQWISHGLIPFMILLIFFAGYILYLKKARKANKIEITIALFTVFIISYIVLTIIGIWFRGASMALVTPW